MKVPFVDLYAQYLSIREEIDKAICSVIADSAFIRRPHLDAFEQAWAKTVGVRTALAVDEEA
jgi:dTDP-4-amino-4,6-dideoxygalactose transaminase